MGEKTNEIIDSIKKTLKDGPKSISDISKEAKINWRTAEEYLKLLKNLGLVIEQEIKNTRTFFYKEKKNYFDLPIRKEHSKIISTIYSLIRKFCLDVHKTEPTKTQAYKILWNIDMKAGLNLPIGWYMYGPCCVQVYKGDEDQQTKLNKKTVTLIKETTTKYCLCDNFELQNRVYKEANNKLYRLKEKLITTKFKTKEDINPVLMDLIKFAPKETIEVVTDFVRATLLLGWDKTKECFNYVWHYIALIVFRDTIQEYYLDWFNGEHLDLYLKVKIDEARKESQILITDIVRCRSK